MRLKSKNFPGLPRYHQVDKKAMELLNMIEEPSLPTRLSDFSDLVPNLRIVKYQDCLKDFKKRCFQKSEDGFLECFGDKYVVFYNANKPLSRLRFTIAHELGHYFLNHLEIINRQFMCRDSLSEKEYERLEVEANNFAKLILVPKHIYLLGKNTNYLTPLMAANVFSVSLLMITYTFESYSPNVNTRRLKYIGANLDNYKKQIEILNNIIETNKFFLNVFDIEHEPFDDYQLDPDNFKYN